MSASPILQAIDVVRRIDGEVPFTLINGISLDIQRGEFMCIMGPSGSGKSSLLYMLGLLDLPTEGRIVLDGEDTTHYSEDELSDRRLAKLGFVFQFHFLLAEFKVIDNVTLPMRKLGFDPISNKEPQCQPTAVTRFPVKVSPTIL